LITQYTVKLADLGMAAKVGSGASFMSGEFYFGTRNYRAPECFLSQPYSFPVDLWACGCIMAELFLQRPLFVGSSVRRAAARCTRGGR
jgi:serine/threonine protein kinase